MIPILYSSSANPKIIAYDNNMGIGRLNDCISAVVTEERNGIYELEIEYPINGEYFDRIECNSWIKAKPYVGGDNQVFRVYRISKPVNGICTVNAEHVSYMLTQAVVKLGDGTTDPPSLTCSQAFTEITAKTIDSRYVNTGTWGFSFTNYKSTNAQSFIMDKARSIREYLLGAEYSILTVYGEGDYLFDNFNVYFSDLADEGTNTRGHDNGVRIQYGKNMTSLKMEESDDNVITDFYPYIVIPKDATSVDAQNRYASEDLSYFGESIIVPNPLAQYYQGCPRVMPLNLKDFEKWKNVETSIGYSIWVGRQDYYDCVNDYIADHPESGAPSRSIDVSFVDLSSTDEYKNIMTLESINLCDIVTVYYPQWNIGVDEKFRVVKTEYNVLEERYNNLTLGAIRKTLK